MHITCLFSDYLKSGRYSDRAVDLFILCYKANHPAWANNMETEASFCFRKNYKKKCRTSIVRHSNKKIIIY